MRIIATALRLKDSNTADMSKAKLDYFELNDVDESELAKSLAKWIIDRATIPDNYIPDEYIKPINHYSKYQKYTRPHSHMKSLLDKVNNITREGRVRKLMSCVIDGKEVIRTKYPVYVKYYDKPNFFHEGVKYEDGSFSTDCPFSIDLLMKGKCEDIEQVYYLDVDGAHRVYPDGDLAPRLSNEDPAESLYNMFDKNF